MCGDDEAQRLHYDCFWYGEQCEDEFWYECFWEEQDCSWMKGQELEWIREQKQMNLQTDAESEQFGLQTAIENFQEWVRDQDS